MAQAEVMELLQPAVLALGWTLVDALWQAALIAAGYALLRALLDTPRLRVTVGHLAVLALLITPVATFLRHLRDQMASTGGAAPDSVVAGLADRAVRVGVDAVGGFETWLPWIVALWAAGVFILSTRQLLQWRELRRVCHAAVPLDAPWPERFAALTFRLGVGAGVRLRHSGEVSLPLLVGVLRPTILMPTALMARLPADQVELILLHELAHLRRLDPIFNLAQNVADTLLFFHPAVHWISRRLRDDRELACDQLVLQHGADRMRYARILLTLAESHGTAPSMALAAAGGVLLDRVERIVDVPRSARPAPRAYLPILAMFGVALLTVVSTHQQRRWAEAELRAFAPFLALATQIAPALRPQVGDLETGLQRASWTLRLPASPTDLGRRSDAGEVLPAPLPVPVALQPHAPAVSPEPFQPTLQALATPSGLQAQPAFARATASAAPPSDSDTLLPRHREPPVYPARARERGIEGHVVLSFRVGRDGRAYDIDVERAEPADEFHRAASEALLQWRFDPAAASSALQRVRFDFVLGETSPAAGGEDTSQCLRRTGSHLCRAPRDAALRTLVVSGR